MLVTFEKSKVKVTHNGNTIIEGKIIPGTSLYAFDLIELLNAPAVDTSDNKLNHGNSYPSFSSSDLSVLSTTKRYNPEKIKGIKWIHESLNHMPYSTMANNVRFGIWKNIPEWMTASFIDAVAAKDADCVPCAVTKWNRLPKAVGSGISQLVIGNSLSFDYVQCKPTSYYGYNGMFIWECLATGLVSIIGATDKSDSLVTATESVIQFYSQHGWKVKSARCDSGSVEASEKFSKICANLHIAILPSAPEEQRSNPEERYSQELKKGIQVALLGQENLTNRHWFGASQAAACARNVSRNVRSMILDPEKSPLQLVTRVKPDLTHIGKMGFGQLVVVPSSGFETGHLPYLQSKNQLAVFLAPKLDGSSASYVILEGNKNPTIRKQLIPIKSSTINLTIKQAELTTPNTSLDGSVSFKSNVSTDFSLKTNISNEHDANFPTKETPDDTEINNIYKPEIGWGKKLQEGQISTPITRSMKENDSDLNQNETETEIDYWNINDNAAPNLTKYKNYSTKITKILKERDHTNPSSKMIKNSAELQKKWTPSIRKEIDGLVNKGCLSRVTKEEAESGTIVPSKLTCTTKENDLLKSRYVWRGDIDKRKNPMEKSDLYSPNISSSTVMMLLSIGTYLGLEITASDVERAFGNNPYKREKPIYTFIDESISKSGEKEYYKAGATGYGLQEASRVWYEEYDNLLTEIGSIKSQFDPCLWIWQRGNGLLINGVTTDDALRLNSPNEEGRKMLQELREAIAKKGWVITEQDTVKTLLGMVFQHNTDGSLTLTQGKQIKRIKNHFYPNTDYKDIPQNFNPTLTTWTHEASSNSPKTSLTEYLSAVGTLIFMLKTRYETSTIISILSGKGQDPSLLDLEATYHLATYFLSTATVGITFRRGEKRNNIVKFIGAADAAFDVYPDSRSQFGWMEKQGNEKSGAFIAKSKKEKGPPSDSTCTAEMGSLAELIKDTIVFRGMAEEMGFLQSFPTPILEDNQSVCQLTKGINGSGKAKRIRHIARRLNFIAGYIDDKTIELINVPTNKQEANILTKILRSTIDHWRETEKLLGESQEITDIQNIVSNKAQSRKSAQKVFTTTQLYDNNNEKIMKELITTLMTHNPSLNDEDFVKGMITVINTYYNERENNNTINTSTDMDANSGCDNDYYNEDNIRNFVEKCNNEELHKRQRI